MLCVCVLFLSACPERKRYQKERDPGYVSGATPTLPFADGARTRFAQTDRPLPAPDTCAYAGRLRSGGLVCVYKK